MIRKQRQSFQKGRSVRNNNNNNNNNNKKYGSQYIAS